MEAATKKKRGRPRRELYQFRIKLKNENSEPFSDRAIQNDVHRENIDCLLMDLDRYDIQSFFLDSNGNPKRKGILEQVGRMADAGLLKTDEDVITLLEVCIAAYNKGLPCKTIERRLRQLRLEKVNPNKIKIE